MGENRLLPLRREDAYRVWVVIPHPLACEAGRCRVPAASHLVWLDRGMLRTALVCLGHAEALSLAGPAATCPLGTLPPLEHVAALLRQRAREARDTEAQQWYGQHFRRQQATGSTTFTMTWNVR